ncbi:DUF4132 domain-containing protein [Streptomyces sp. YIM 130001]|uniref:DUF4132 domain-containing protein n=1 Tax=Streptomyces sp. YIM 130001 TaxID=2259644 RepID=UPI001F09DFDF|nr:DUF4132 domain-containing protein [Streptomyces sp. YIM 130001]
MEGFRGGDDGSVRSGEVTGDGGSVDGAGGDVAVVFPDEESFKIPASWRKVVHPRRGVSTQRVPPPDPEAAQAALARLADTAESNEAFLTSPDSDPQIVAAARAHLDGSPNPLGVAAVTAMNPHWDLRDGRMADAWVLTHGLPFAARAAVAYSDVAARWTQRGRERRDRHLVREPDDGSLRTYPMRYYVSDRIRALIAVSDDDTYAEVVAALAESRDCLRRRIVVSYLVPGEQGWVEECCSEADAAGPQLRAMLLCSLGSAQQVEKFPRPLNLVPADWSMRTTATLAEGTGQAFAPLLDEALTGTPSAGETRWVARALAELPNDDALRILVTHAGDKNVRASLARAMERYPLRATRVLAAVASGGRGKQAESAAGWLTQHVLAHRTLLEAALGDLAPEVVDRIAPLLDGRDRVADAPATALPAVLADPPWARKRPKAPEPRVAGTLPAAPEPQLVWEPGEEEEWSVVSRWIHQRAVPEDQLAQRMEQLRAGRERAVARAVPLLLFGPTDEIRALLPDYAPVSYGNETQLKPLAAKFGTDALGLVLGAARSKTAGMRAVVLPFLSTEVAALVGDWLLQAKAAESTARGWLARHGLAAVPYLLPAAVGPVGTARSGAEAALKLLAVRHGIEAVREAAAPGGQEAAGIVAEILDSDPMEFALPKRVPALPAWADPAALPQILLTDGGGALCADATRHALTMLAMSRPGDTYPGVAVLRQHCTPASLAAFAWGLFERWQLVGMPGKEGWVLDALGLLGDDETVRRLSPLLRIWPGEAAHQRAVAGLDVLAAIGSDVALMHLHGISQRVKFKGLRARAAEKITEVADELGLTAEQLGDRLVPDLGLDADGSTVVDYGPRRFTVGFDEQLRPFVRDEAGKVRKALPAPGVKDDQELAPAERKRFAALKKDVRTVASDQVLRLEQAMVTQRSWTTDEFHRLFVAHPLLWHLVRRLVWLSEADGTVRSFRVAEDRTFADVEDDALTLPEKAAVRVAHPLDLGAEQDVWSELFADYEILQPFRQLGRPAYALTEEEAAGYRLARFEGIAVPVGKLLGLTQRGWERGAPQDGGMEEWMSRRVGRGRWLNLDLTPGIPVGMVHEFGDQTLRVVWLGDSASAYFQRDVHHPLRLGDLDPVTVSELLTDLTEVTGR